MSDLVLFGPPAPRPRTREEIHADAMARGAECQHCPLYGCGRGPVMGTIIPGAKLLVVGEAPGASEVTEGRGFVGASGRVLDASLEAGGLSRASVSVTNTILCMPPDGAFDDYVETLKTEHAKGVKRWTRRWAGNGKGVTPEEWARTAQLRFRAAYDAALREGVTPPEGPPELSLPQDRCRARLHKDLVEANATVVLAVGKKALEQVTTFEDLMTGGGRGPAPHVASLKKQHGAPVVLPDGRVLMASYHPAFAMRERCEYMPVIRANIERAARIVVRGGRIDWHEPPFLISPDVDLCLRTLDRFLKARAEVAVDIETDDIDPHTCGLRCVGLAAHVGGEEVVICIPFRRRDGAFWWDSYEDGMRIALKLREVLDTLPLVFQNGQFDVTVLLRVRLMTNGAKTYSDCYLDAETEFLTDRGWLRFDDVRDSDRLATTDSNGYLKYQRAIARTDAISKGPLYCFETRTTRAVVTGNHRMWAQPYARGRKRRGSWGFRCAEALLRGPDEHFFRTAFDPEPYDGDATYEVDGIKLDVYWMILLGLYLSDGSISYQGDKIRGIAISQQQNGKASGAFGPLQRAFQFRKYTRMRTEAWRTRPVVEETWRLCRPDLARQVERWCGRYSADKHLPSFTFELPSSLRLELLENLLLGDGSETNECVQTYRSISKSLADGVQVLALSVGRPATMRRSHVGQQDQTYDVRIDREQETETRVQTVLKKVYANGSWRGAVTRVGEAGARIVCFTVPNETLVTRSRGNPSFHGNTLLHHHNTPDNDLPHDLGFLARRFFEAPLWKENIDHKSVSSQSDFELHEYNCRDTLITLRLMTPLRAWVEAMETDRQNETDRRMSVHTREMSELGLVCNEWLRGKLSRRLNRQCYDLVREFQAIVGRDVNPRSSAQLQELLYVDWGYQPVIATDGYEWEEDVDDISDGSTSNAAITQLIDLRAPQPKHVQALEKLLEFRANDKIRGTYTDNLKTYDLDWSEFDGGPLAVGWVDPIVAPVWDEALGREVEREVAPRRRALSLVRTTYKGFVVPTGRLASSNPNCQNVPARARGGLNLRDMYVAPPGHVLVGADFNQIELRLYAAIAKDRLLLQAIRTGLDAHTLNAASMMAKPSQKLMDVYHWLKAKPKEELKYLRTVAKRFCVAEGQRVLTERGPVPIEKVLLTDRLWDGTEWVSHDGVIDQGEREVITYDGLTATPDHEVYLEDGRKVPFGTAAAQHLRLARGSEGWRPLRFVGCDERSVAREGSSEGEGPLRVWRREGGLPGQPAVWKVDAVPQLRDEDRALGRRTRHARVGAGPLSVGEEPLHQARCWPHSGGDHPRGERHGSAASWPLAEGRRTSRVYDILNAGPRRRYTVAGRIASNCFGLVYGSGWQTMYNVMVADRDKATGKRTFPNLTQRDCQEWEEAWHTNHPETKAWHAACHAAFKMFGFAGSALIDYRKRFFPGGVAQENAIPNMSIQSAAAAIANRALLAIAEEIPHRGWSKWSGLVLQVHDYIGVVVPESRYEEAIAILERCMLYSYEGMTFDAQATATWSWGDQ